MHNGRRLPVGAGFDAVAEQVRRSEQGLRGSLFSESFLEFSPYSRQRAVDIPGHEFPKRQLQNVRR